MHETWDQADEASAETIADTTRVRAFLIAAARRREAVSYSELLIALGHRFTRPKMRAVCKTLDAIDAEGAASGERTGRARVRRPARPGMVDGRTPPARGL